MAEDVHQKLQAVRDPDVQASLLRCPGTPTPRDSGVRVEGTTTGAPSTPGGRFLVLRPHAEGGLGKVSVALDQELPREVAFKEIREKLAEDPESRARFVREAEITGALEHPGVVPVYAMGAYPDGRPFYVMRFVRGRSFKDAIDRFHQTAAASQHPGERSVEFRKLLDRFVAVCNAVAYAHSRGVIHRDLKPANVMLGNYGETLVVDWGLARLVERAEGTAEAGEPTIHLAMSGAGDSELTQMGRALGTPAYMSPEQAAGKLDCLGPASDVYSLGASLYYLLAGEAPFRDTDLGLVLAQVEEGRFPAPGLKRPGVPVALEAVCLKAMALRPNDRYPSARALADDVEHWLADEAVAAYAEPLAARLGRWVRRHRGLVVTGAAAAAVALTVVISWGLVTTAGEQQARERDLRAVAEEEKIRAEERQVEADRQRSSAEAKQLEADQQRALVRRLLYFSRIHLADRAWQDAQLSRMDELLLDQGPNAPGSDEFRGFEWHYLRALRHSYYLEIQGHTSSIHKLAYSPDGKLLATASEDNTVKIWDAEIGAEVATLQHTKQVWSVAFSPDGKRLATGSGLSDGVGRKGPGETKVWDVKTWSVAKSFTGHACAVMSVAWSPDGERLATASEDKSVKIWDTRSPKLVHTLKGHACGIHSVAYSPNGKLLATGSANQEQGNMLGEVKLWDAATGLLVRTLKEHSGMVFGVAFSPDGQRLAASFFQEQTVKVWDVTTGAESLTLKGHTQPVLCVCFSPDGKRLASGGLDQTVRVWDATTGQEAFTLKGHTGEVMAVVYSSDGRRLASTGGIWPKAGEVKIWDAQTGQAALTLKGHRKSVCSVVLSPEGRRLASADLDGRVKVWDADTGQEILSLVGYTGLQGPKPFWHIAFSPDSKHLAIPSGEDALTLWDTQTGRADLILKGHPERVLCVAFRSDGRRLATGSRDHTVKVWDTATGREVFIIKGHTGSILAVAYSPDGKHLVSASGGLEAFDLKIWDADNGRAIHTLEGHTNWVFGVACSPDSQHLASASADGTVRIWDAHSGKEAMKLNGHTSAVLSVAYSPDGQRLASASLDGTVKIWDVQTGQEALTLKGNAGPVFSVTFSADGKRVAGATMDGTVMVWEGVTPSRELQARRQAVRLVEALFSDFVRRRDVIAAIGADRGMSEPLRQEALAVAERFVQDPGKLNESSWIVASRPGASAAAYRRALAQAEEACRLDPKDDGFAATLAIAQYRTAEYAKALEGLTRRERRSLIAREVSTVGVVASPLETGLWASLPRSVPGMPGSHPGDLAFIAMAQHQLGQKDEARTSLARLRQVLKLPAWAGDAVVAGFLGEAEKLVEGKPDLSK